MLTLMAPTYACIYTDRDCKEGHADSATRLKPLAVVSVRVDMPAMTGHASTCSKTTRTTVSHVHRLQSIAMTLAGDSGRLLAGGMAPHPKWQAAQTQNHKSGGTRRISISSQIIESSIHAGGRHLVKRACVVDVHVVVIVCKGGAADLQIMRAAISTALCMPTTQPASATASQCARLTTTQGRAGSDTHVAQIAPSTLPLSCCLGQ